MAERVDTPEELANEAGAIAQAVSWMVNAKHVLDRICDAAACHPDFEAQLKRFSIPYGGPEWDGAGMPDAVAFLLMRQRELIGQLAGVRHG